MPTTRTPAFWLSLISLILTVSFGVAACALVSGGGPGVTPGAPTATLPTAAPAQPTVAAPTVAAPTVAAPTAAPGQPTVVAPTLAPAQPTAAPTSAPAQPTARPAQPIIGFNPKSGGSGTSVEVFGSGYTPGRWYSVRLGLPQPTGEVLFSAQADGNGRWGGRLIMPATLPSGQSIPTGQLFLVSMDEQNKAIASAPFSFTAAPPQGADEGQRLISTMLEAFRNGADVRPYLGPDYVSQIDAGRPAHQVIGLHPVALLSYTYGASYSYPQADISFQPVTLNYQGFSEERVFALAFHYDATPPAPKIFGSEPAREGRPIATSPEAAAGGLVLELWADRSGRRALPYLSGELYDRLLRGEQVDLLEQGGVGPLLPLRDYRVGKVVADDGVSRYVELTLTLGDQAGVVRFAKAQQFDGGWRIVAVVTSLAGEPAPPASFPGEGWTAWKQGDFNGDGRQETVFLKETGQVNHNRLEDALLNSNSLNATAVLVAQESAHGPWVLLEIDSQSARTSDGHVLPFGEGGPAFFQVSVTYAYEGRFLHVLPLKADGYAYTQALAFKWSPAHSAYRPIGGPNGEW